MAVSVVMDEFGYVCVCVYVCVCGERERERDRLAGPGVERGDNISSLAVKSSSGSAEGR